MDLRSNSFVQWTNIHFILSSDLKKEYIFEVLFFFIFESDTVKSDCPIQESYEILKDLIQTVGLLY